MTSIETVIVGAGPYGLSIAAHLRAAGKPFRIIGQPMESWRRHMPFGMYLKSECFASNLWDPDRKLTYEKFCAATGRRYQAMGRPLPLDEFVEYASWFQKNGVPNVEDLWLDRLDQSADGFVLTLSDGQVWQADRVVLATGHAAYRRIPEIFAGLPDGRVLHTFDINDPKEFAGEDITVIGGGQGSLETAALLHEAGARVRIFVRDRVVGFNRPARTDRSIVETILKPEAGLSAGWRSLFYSELPALFRRLPAAVRSRTLRSTFGPAGSWWLRPRIEGHVDLLTNHEIVGVSDAGDSLALEVETPGGIAKFRTDRIVSGTGFQPDLEKLTFLSPALRKAITTVDGSPLLDGRFQSSVRGLHFVGIASAQSFGPVMRFMYGAKHAAQELAKAA